MGERLANPLGPGQLRGLARRSALARRVGDQLVAAAALGRVHRQVGTGRQLAGGGVIRLERHHADARADPERLTAEYRVALADLREQVLGGGSRLMHVD